MQLFQLLPDLNLQGGDEGGRRRRALLSLRAPKHPYLEANSSTPSKGNRRP